MPRFRTSYPLIFLSARGEQAPTTPGEYKVFVHVRSTGCVGVDVRRKVVFTVKQPKRVLSSKAAIETSSETSTSTDHSNDIADDVPQLL